MAIMPRLIKYLIIVLCFMSSGVVFAGWATSPVVIVSGGWGSDTGQFGIEYGDTSTIFPMSIAVLPDGKIVIPDSVNDKQIVFNSNGTLFKEIKWVLKSSTKDMVNYSIPEYSIGEIGAITKEGNLLTELGGKYYLMSSNGQILTTYADRPLSMGVQKSVKRQPNGSYVTVIQYDDIAYAINAPTKLDYYFRDLFSYVYAVVRVGASDNKNSRVYKYNTCGKTLGFLDLPTDQIVIAPDTEPPQPTPDITVVAKYGTPVIAANGDVYTWKRTPDKYSILKWTWVDDPNVPTGPEPPTNLSLTPSINGLYLTWQASPNDPGCVTKYEIARATTSGGVFTTLPPVEKGVLKYNDTTAEVGTTYYYKVRAMAGSDPSAYTSEVSGKR